MAFFRFHLFRFRFFHVKNEAMRRVKRHEHLFDLVRSDRYDSWRNIPWGRVFDAVTDSLLFILLLSPFDERFEGRPVYTWLVWAVITLCIANRLYKTFRLAPLSRWGKLQSSSLMTGLGLIAVSVVLRIWKPEIFALQAATFYALIGVGALMLVACLYCTLRYRRIKAEAHAEAEQIRRRIARRKKLELL